MQYSGIVAGEQGQLTVCHYLLGPCGPAARSDPPVFYLRSFWCLLHPPCALRSFWRLS